MKGDLKQSNTSYCRMSKAIIHV